MRPGLLPSVLLVLMASGVSCAFGDDSTVVIPFDTGSVTVTRPAGWALETTEKMNGRTPAMARFRESTGKQAIIEVYVARTPLDAQGSADEIRAIIDGSAVRLESGNLVRSEPVVAAGVTGCLRVESPRNPKVQLAYWTFFFAYHYVGARLRTTPEGMKRWLPVLERTLATLRLAHDERSRPRASQVPAAAALGSIPTFTPKPAERPAQPRRRRSGRR